MQNILNAYQNTNLESIVYSSQDGEDIYCLLLKKIKSNIELSIIYTQKMQIKEKCQRIQNSLDILTLLKSIIPPNGHFANLLNNTYLIIESNFIIANAENSQDHLQQNLNIINKLWANFNTTGIF